jgi:hypothetical protein
MMNRVILSLAILGSVGAVCPNSCSGHGTCGADDLCSCYQNWGMADETGGDCSEMYCPFEYAFVDAPDQNGRFHKYMECSGKGICDRATGECECFDGYTGKGCQRHVCPNDCSGHGTCEYVEELTYGTVPGLYWGAFGTSAEQAGVIGYDGIYKNAKTFARSATKLWDHHKSMGCNCDAGWIDVDCSRRMCPKANDVMDERLNLEDTFLYQIQNITLYPAGPLGDTVGNSVTDLAGKTFALTFVSTLNESFTTVPIYVPYADTSSESERILENYIELALKGLPHRVITDVNANVTSGVELRDGDGDANFINIQIEFTGDSVNGPQNLIIVEAEECEEGCTPRITGLPLASVSSSNRPLSFVTESQAADYNNYECGRRGKCDYDSGLCECFEGFTGEACSIQTALI